jgi:hypothetical protein
MTQPAIQAPAAAYLEPDPIEIDPRPCELCGLTIDRHERVDTPEGPLFFCLDVPADDEDIYDAAHIVRRWELDDPRDRWKHTGEPPPAPAIPAGPAKQPYRTPQSTIDAFFVVAGLGDADYLGRWFAQHPLDAPFLCNLWDRKNAQS